MLKAFIFGLILFQLIMPASASEPIVNGEWIQGGLLTVKTNAAYVDILNRRIKVEADGRVTFGLGRDTPAKIELALEYSDGRSEKYTYAVVQREYKTQKISGVEKKYVAPPAEVSARIKGDNKEIRNARMKTREASDFLAQFILPAEGPVTGVYGSQRVFNGVPKRPHYGLDLAGPVGTPVYAPVAGRVNLSHADMYYSGGTLILGHGQGISSTFIHLSKLHVKVGDMVKQGQLIAEIGATGRVTGPHLDWRINWFEQRLDPALVMKGLYLP
ncbi:MAG: murein DD-endopeptidase MepM/ murein hydrolase activator NlpD [Flavobacteriales bacterium]|jgi:murein DD-endopeptidase MepM/ murein hydrolase activator NlpD